MAISKEHKRILDDFLARLAQVTANTGVDVNETDAAKSKRIERCLKDFKFFVSYYFPHYADAPTPPFHTRLANNARDKRIIKRIVRWGRSLGKSVVCDLFIPMWLNMIGETKYFVLIGNTYDKAKLLLSDLQAEFEANQRIISDYGPQIKHGTWTDGFFTTISGFTAQALGMGQSVRGLRVGSIRPDLVVFDDGEDQDTVKNPTRQNEIADWVLQDLIPIMDGPRRRFLFVGTRHAPRTIGSVLEEKMPEWEVDEVMAYDPATKKPTWEGKYPDDYFINIEKEIGTLAALAEYCNKPHVKGEIFLDSQFNYIAQELYPPMSRMKMIVGHWDPAYAGNPTSDYNAVRVWGVWDNRFWHYGTFCKQTKMRAALLWMSFFQKSLPEGVRVRWQFENQFWNDELERTIREVEKETGVKLNLVKVDRPTGNKFERIVSLQPYYQNSRVNYSQKDLADNDCQVANAQLKAIGKKSTVKDDGPDADEQCIKYLDKYASLAGAGKVRRGNNNKPRRTF